MISANIATAKNELSRLLRQVKRGETVIITERDHPIARLEPITAAAGDTRASALVALYDSGALIPPKASAWNVQAFLASLPQNATLPPEKSLASAVLDDREEST